MSVAWDNVPDEKEDGTEALQADSDDSRIQEDKLEFIELLSEMYVTVGVAAPCFLAVMGVTFQLLGRNNGELVIQVLPILSFTVTMIIVGLTQKVLSGMRVTEEFRDSARVYEAVLVISIVIIVFVFSMMEHSLLNLIQDLEVDVVTDPYLLATVCAVGFPTGYMISYLEKQSTVLGVLSGVLVASGAGVLYWGLMMI